MTSARLTWTREKKNCWMRLSIHISRTRSRRLSVLGSIMRSWIITTNSNNSSFLKGRQWTFHNWRSKSSKNYRHNNSKCIWAKCVHYQDHWCHSRFRQNTTKSTMRRISNNVRTQKKMSSTRSSRIWMRMSKRWLIKMKKLRENSNSWDKTLSINKTNLWQTNNKKDNSKEDKTLNKSTTTIEISTPLIRTNKNKKCFCV